jgi:hypothetical protein
VNGLLAGRSGIQAAASVTVRRVYRDYFQRERLDDFRRLLECAVGLDYRTMTLSAFAEMAVSGQSEWPSRILLLRHDIDSDVARARRMWQIERELGVVGSYFFRRSTWDLSFMRELAAAGYEAGYHYEELATLVKERGAATAAEARALLVPARARLESSLADLRAGSGLALDVLAARGGFVDTRPGGVPGLEVLAAHGDFANRVVGVSNQELLADTDFRAKIGVRLEAYDVEAHVDARSSDGAKLTYWWPRDPVEALQRGERVVEVLLHPRSWGGAPMVNVRLDSDRLREAWTYRVHKRHALR